MVDEVSGRTEVAIPPRATARVPAPLHTARALSPAHYIPPRATARVPAPLHTAPALTMRTQRSSLATSHSKGGGGVERGGDPCGRPGGGRGRAGRWLL